MDVQQTTSAPSIVRCTSSRPRCCDALSLRSLSLSTPHFFAAISSAQCRRSSGRAISGRPRRTTCTPRRARPSTRLSTAMLESLVATSAVFLPRKISPEERTHCLKICTAVAVFPVPGGPCTNASEFRIATSIAWFWLGFMPSTSMAAQEFTRRSGGIFAYIATSLLPMIVLEIGPDGVCFFPNRFPFFSPFASLCVRSGSLSK
mmetsp:Transcript_46401/g.129085  ORF Transcript_46401/g.129085 Transcript_46401/m.129085 type:complete len:204 (-) Transcript_46401:795-1406(-)